MDLIKRIQQAESEAQRIIEQAKQEAASMAEKAIEQRQSAWQQAQIHRKKVIEAAVQQAHKDGHLQVEALKSQVQAQHQQTIAKAHQLIPGAVEKVVAYIIEGARAGATR